MFLTGNSSLSHVFAKNIYAFFSSAHQLLQKTYRLPLKFTSQSFNVFSKHTSVRCSAHFLPTIPQIRQQHTSNCSMINCWDISPSAFLSFKLFLAVSDSCLKPFPLKFVFFFPPCFFHSSSPFFPPSFLAFFLRPFGLFDPTSKPLCWCTWETRPFCTIPSTRSQPGMETFLHFNIKKKKLKKILELQNSSYTTY